MKRVIVVFIIFCNLILFYQSCEAMEQISYYSSTLHLSKQKVEKLMLFAEENNVDFELVYELLNVETGGTFDNKAIGPQTKYGRAYGIAQFMENTAPWVASLGGLPYKGKEDLFKAEYSIQLTIIYLHYLQYGGENHPGYHNWHATLTAYNRGMHGLKIYKNDTGTVVSTYSTAIMKKTKK